MDFFSTTLGDGLLKLLVTLVILAGAWVVVRTVFKMVGRIAALGCLAVIIVGIVVAILILQGGLL